MSTVESQTCRDLVKVHPRVRAGGDLVNVHNRRTDQ